MYAHVLTFGGTGGRTPLSSSSSSSLELLLDSSGNSEISNRTGLPSVVGVDVTGEGESPFAAAPSSK